MGQYLAESSFIDIDIDIPLLVPQGGLSQICLKLHFCRPKLNPYIDLLLNIRLRQVHSTNMIIWAVAIWILK